MQHARPQERSGTAAREPLSPPALHSVTQRLQPVHLWTHAGQVLLRKQWQCGSWRGLLGSCTASAGQLASYRRASKAYSVHSQRQHRCWPCTASEHRLCGFHPLLMPTGNPVSTPHRRRQCQPCCAAMQLAVR